MSRDAEDLFVARTEALALSTVQASEEVDRSKVEAAIRATLRAHGTVGACAAALAERFGDQPEATVVRIRWARDTVATVYAAA